MDLIFGVTLVFSLLVLLYLGPEWIGTFSRKARRAKRAARPGGETRTAFVAARRRTARLDSDRGKEPAS